MPSINQGLTQVFDFAPWIRSRPDRSVLFAATPRCGGTFICTSFWKTGVAGAPLEYTNRRMAPELTRVKTEAEFRTYWRSIQRRRTSPSGVFSFKMFPYYFLEVINRFGTAVDELYFDSVIYLHRRDLLAQAISYARAIQTDRWFGTSEEKSSPVYNYDLIRDRMIFLMNQNIAWEGIFKKYDIAPISIAYEDFLSLGSEIVNDTLDKLSISIRDFSVVDVPPLTVQRDHVNKMWRRRYLTDVEKRDDTLGFALTRVDTSLSLR